MPAYIIIIFCRWTAVQKLRRRSPPWWQKSAVKSLPTPHLPAFHFFFEGAGLPYPISLIIKPRSFGRQPAWPRRQNSRYPSDSPINDPRWLHLFTTVRPARCKTLDGPTHSSSPLTLSLSPSLAPDSRSGSGDGAGRPRRWPTLRAAAASLLLLHHHHHHHAASSSRRNAVGRAA